MKIIHVVGQGPSIDTFVKNKNHFKKDKVIGINNVAGKVSVDDLVLINPPERKRPLRGESKPRKNYTDDDLKEIAKHKYKNIFVRNAKAWEPYKLNAEKTHEIQLHDCPAGLLHSEFHIWKSITALFAAVVIAFRQYQPDQIILWGADFAKFSVNNKYLLRQDFEKLRDELKENNCQLLLGDATGSILKTVLKEAEKPEEVKS